MFICSPICILGFPGPKQMGNDSKIKGGSGIREGDRVEMRKSLEGLVATFLQTKSSTLGVCCCHLVNTAGQPCQNMRSSTAKWKARELCNKAKLSLYSSFLTHYVTSEASSGVSNKGDRQGERVMQSCLCIPSPSSS